MLVVRILAEKLGKKSQGRLQTVYYTTSSPFFRPACLLLRWINLENHMWHIRELKPADSTPHLNRYMIFVKEEH
jgi:hypothetical protein